MARLPRLVVPNHLHHLVARGNNEQSVFIDDADYQQFLQWLREAARRWRVAIHAYALLPNRVHLLATPADADGLGKMMQAVGRLYVPYFNSRHRRTGSLWEGRFRATVVDADQYFLGCAHLVEFQPVRAGLAVDMAAWPWSSHAHHVGLRREAWLVDHPSYWRLGNTPFDREMAYQQLCAVPPERGFAESIAEATHKGWALGSEAFQAGLARLTERRLQPARRGRPRKEGAAEPAAEPAALPARRSRRRDGDLPAD